MLIPENWNNTALTEVKKPRISARQKINTYIQGKSSVYFYNDPFHDELYQKVIEDYFRKLVLFCQSIEIKIACSYWFQHLLIFVDYYSIYS